MYVDGSWQQNWSVGGGNLNPGQYNSVQDYSFGTLMPGTHTITVIADPDRWIPESDESDNQYTKTITVVSAPNLTPYQPSGWSDKIVVSKITGTTTDSTQLTTADDLYVDWAVLNNGSKATSGTFYTEVYVDDVLRESLSMAFPVPPLYYLYDKDYSIGGLSAGTHTIKIIADTTNAIAESDESDNEYTKTITVIAETRPNLTPYQPAGWSDKIVVSRTTGTNTDSTILTTADTLYVDWAVVNNGGGATAAAFSTSLYVDNVLVTSSNTSSPLNVDAYGYISDYNLGHLTAGTHTLKIVADSGGAITEIDETDNQYSKTITVVDASNYTIAVSTNPKPPIKNQQFTFTLSGGFNPTTVEVFFVGPNCPSNTSCVVPNSALTSKTSTSISGNATLSEGSFTVQARNTATGSVSSAKGLYVASQSGTSAPRVLVLMVDFSDKPGQAVASFFQTMLFGNHPASAPQGSFRDFYKEISYQAFDPDGAVNDATIAWIRLPQTLAYYTNKQNGFGAYPQNAQKMVEDAVIAAKNRGLDFGPFDANNDGYVDAMFVVHAGAGAEATGNANDIWSHAWVTSGPIDTGSTNAAGSTVFVYQYTTEPEYFWSPGDITMGVFAHEYGHTRFGLPDLYDTDYTSEGIGDWSLMAAGSWNGSPDGASPAHMDAWSKWYSGFLTPTKITSTALNQQLRQVSAFPDVFQILNGSAVTQTGEYFLIENRNRTGFDSGLPSSGLLIWHIDESRSGNNNETYPGCAGCAGHYLVQLVQADNRWDLEKGSNRGDSGDPYPGICVGSCNTSWTAVTSPNSNLWSGNTSGVSIANISAPGATMTANIFPAPVAAPTVTINQAPLQADPTPGSPVNFTVVFSESVTGFATGDVTLSGSAGATTATVSGSGNTYSVSVSGMTNSGTVIATIPAGIATASATGLPNVASTSTDNTVVYTGFGVTVTIDQAVKQVDPATSSPINFTVVFSEAMNGFTSSDVNLSGTAPYTNRTVTISGTGPTYNVAVGGFTGPGTVMATIPSGIATAVSSGTPNQASTSSDNVVTLVKKRAGQVTSN